MAEWVNVFNEKFQEILGLIQAWWFLISAFLVSCWLFIKKIWPWAKGLWETNKKIKNIENEKKFLALREELLAAKEGSLLAKKEIARLGEANQKLTEQLMIKENVIWKNEILYCSGLEICSRCYDTSSSVDRKTVRLLLSNRETPGSFYCPECKTHHETTEAAAQESKRHKEAVRQFSERQY